MIKQILRICAAAHVWVLFGVLAAPISAESLILESADNAYSVDAQLSYLLTTNNMSVLQVVKNQDDFAQHAEQSVLNLGYSDQTLWVRFALNNQSQLEQWILEYGYYPPKVFEVYRKSGNGPYQRVNLSESRWPSRYLAHDISLAPGANELLLKIQTNASLTVPLTISSPKRFAQQKQLFYFAQALYFGWVASLILYNLFLFFSFRDSRFSYYVLFASSLALALAFYYGFPQQFFGIEYTNTTTMIGTVLFNLASLFAISFARRFLNTAFYTPAGDKILSAISVVFWASIVTVIIWPEAVISSWLLSLGAPVGAVVALVIAVVCLLHGYKQARFFLIAWSALLLASAVASLRNFGWVETTPFTSYAIQIGSAIEMLFLAIALADSLRIERIQKEHIQEASLADSLASQKILTSNQSELERKVYKRTQNIQASLFKVQSAFKTYMRLGAMISHEFKNPLNAILNQIETLNMERKHGIDQSEKRLTSIDGQAKRLKNLFEHWLSTDQLISGQLSTDFKTLSLLPWLQETKELIESIHADRKFMFHMDVSPETEVNMDATLVQIGFFNLVDNACRYSPEQSTIRIFVEVSGPVLSLGVINLPIVPMADEALNECMDTYYVSPKFQQTGTGLGLSLVRVIAETHYGSLDARLVESSKVQFAMRLPAV